MRNNMTRVTAKNDANQFDNSTSWKDKTLNQLVLKEF